MRSPNRLREHHLEDKKDKKCEKKKKKFFKADLEK
jgi:hypothetical protein